MNKKYFFLSFLFLFLVGGVVAETCTTSGEINYDTGMFCNSGGGLEALKADGSACLNNYECLEGSCFEGICQSSYGGIVERRNLLQRIWDFVTGQTPDPVCGNNIREGTEQCDDGCLLGVPNVCESVDNGDGCSSTCTTEGTTPPGGGDSCRTVWTCGNWSNRAGSCGTRTCTKNNCNSVSTIPERTRTCPGVISFCGDYVCDRTERCGTTNVAPKCLMDCGVCGSPPAECGDEACDDDEDFESCPEDCPKKPNYLWIIILVVILLLSLIGFVTFVLFKKYNELNQDETTTKPKTNPADKTSLVRPMIKPAISPTDRNKIAPVYKKGVNNLNPQGKNNLNNKSNNTSV